jgi:hypothetical protein
MLFSVIQSIFKSITGRVRNATTILVLYAVDGKTPWLELTPFNDSEPSYPSSKNPSLKLPVEIVEYIADILFQAKPPVANLGDVAASICLAKPNWSDVASFMAASPDLHNIGFIRWIRVLSILDSEDWNQVLRYSHLVR